MIGYVLKMYPRFSETFIVSEILELERRGVPLTIISLKKPNDGRFHEDLARVRAGVKYLPERAVGHPLRYARAHLRAVRRAPGTWLGCLALALRHLPASWKGFVRAPLVAEAAAARGCTRLHAHFASLPAITAMFAARLLDVPFTFTAHAKDIYHEERSERLLAHLLHAAERVVTVSEFNRRHLRAVGGAELPEDRIALVYNHVDARAFTPSPRDVSAGVTPTILAVGRLVEKKGFADLVDACARLVDRGVDFRCRIVGKGPLEAALAARIRERGIADRVTLEGPRPRGEIARLLGESTLLAAPCVIGRDGNRDGLPTVILEAMASGLPVVSTRVTGIPEAVVDGVTGRLVEPGDVAGLADALAAMLADPAACAAMGRAARERVLERFDVRRSIDALAAVFAGRFPETPADGTTRDAEPAGAGR
ncbi:MAG: glycosyltransferase family 4 protein [Acidobacteriota bacterium]